MHICIFFYVWAYSACRPFPIAPVGHVGHAYPRCYSCGIKSTESGSKWRSGGGTYTNTSCSGSKRVFGGQRRVAISCHTVFPSPVNKNEMSSCTWLYVMPQRLLNQYHMKINTLQEILPWNLTVLYTDSDREPATLLVLRVRHLQVFYPVCTLSRCGQQYVRSQHSLRN